MNIKFDRFPGGRVKALTLSYDDGRVHDRRLVETMNRYGLKGTFHLNSGLFGNEGYLTAEEVSDLFAGHEISAHTVTHPFLTMTPTEEIATEILNDRSALEALAGYPVRGMSYPFGNYDDRVVNLLPAYGIEYSRTVNSHGQFSLPGNLLTWHPTCHHQNMLKYGKTFVELKDRFSSMRLLYVWGHSYEFEENSNWDELEAFGELAGGRDEIWYATNIEIVDYLTALRMLRLSVSRETIYNPSALEVWISADGDALPIPAGSLVELA